MSWSPIPVPTRNLGASRAAAVTVACIVSKRAGARLAIHIRPALLDGGADWWTGGSPVEALLGGGEHEGMIRLVPKGPHVLAKVTGGRGGASAPAILRLLPLPGMTTEKRKPEAVEFDHGEDWIEITLPPWARRSATNPVHLPSAAPAEPVPFTSVTRRVADPAVARAPARSRAVIR